MSLILDALRKSEAERRRGQAPGLFVETVPALAAARSHRTLVIAVAIAAFLLLLAVLSWPRPGTAPTSAKGTTGIAEPDTSAQAGPSREPEPLPAPVPPPPSPIQPLAPAAEPVATVAASTGQTAPAVARTLPPAASPNPAPVPALAPATAEPPASPPAPTQEALPPLAILAASERAGLPPMKLSMHVWNSEADKRFAIVDGQRIAEGSLIGNSVVEEIRRDGVVLNINGRRVLLSRP